MEEVKGGAGTSVLILVESELVAVAGLLAGRPLVLCCRLSEREKLADWSESIFR